jgi:hypothetical protein
MRVLGFMYFFIIANYQSFSATSIHIPRSQSTLIATKNSKQHMYNIGTHLFIRYNKYSQKFSGQLYDVSNDSVVIKINSKSTDVSQKSTFIFKTIKFYRIFVVEESNTS